MERARLDREMCGCLERKLELSKEYFSLTKLMQQELNAKERDAIEGIVAKRQVCIAKIERIDRKMEKMRNSHHPVLRNVSRGCRVKIEDYIKKIRQIMENLLPLDRQLLQAVAEETENLKGELAKMQGGRRVVRGYRQAGGTAGPPRFLDKLR